MRRWLGGVGVLLVIALFAWITLEDDEEQVVSTVPLQATPTLVFGLGELSVISPQAEWKARGNYAWQSAADILYMIEGNSLRTNGTGRAMVTLLTGNQIMLSSDTELEVLALRGQTTDEGQVVIAVNSGQVMIEAEHLRIEAPNLSINANDATLEIIVIAEETILNVLEGDVQALDGAGNTQNLEAGESFHTSSGLIQAIASPSQTATSEPTPTNTLQPSATDTFSPTLTQTALPTNTLRPSVTDTALPTLTRTILPTNTLRPSATDTVLPSFTPTNTPLPTNTRRPSATLTSSPNPTFTPLPTNPRRPSATPTEVQCIGRITSESGLFARQEANPDSEPIGVLPFGAEVILLGQSSSGNWYKVSHPDLAADGWMASQLLETTDVCRIEMPIIE